MDEQTDFPVDRRHVGFGNVDYMWSYGVDVKLPVEGDPPCAILLKPTENTIQLVTVLVGAEPDLSKLRNVSARVYVEDDAEMVSIVARVDESVHAAYGLLASIADGVQLDGLSVSGAAQAALQEHRNLLAGRDGLSPEKEVGLYGELLFLEHIIAEWGSERALDSWAGPLSEEHDFVFPTLRIEVKTTSSEHRRHMITSLEQLMPQRGIPLSLLSIQLTKSAHSMGRTLSQLVGSIRSLCGGPVPELEDRLAGCGWKDEHARLYRTAWTLRSSPAAFPVEGDFPRILPALIAGQVPHPELVSDVQYRIDLTNMSPGALPQPFSGFTGMKG